MKQFFIIFVTAALLSILISMASTAVPLEQKLIRIHTLDKLDDFPGIEQESIELQAALADMSHDPLLVLKAKAALLRYRAMSIELLSIYGSEPEFQEVFREYGESALPAIQYFVSNPINSIEWMNKAGRQYEAFKMWFETNNELNIQSQVSTSDLTPTERGWKAIGFIRAEGHDFVGQFVVDPEGEVQWLTSERVMEGLTQFFGSGIRQLEQRYRMDEQIEVSDIGWATLDVLVFASAVKVLRVGKTVSASTKTASRSTRSAALTARAISGGRLVLRGARYAKWPVLLGSAYLVIAHPSLINDFLAELAAAIGFPALLIQFLGWLCVLLPILLILRSLLWFIVPFCKAGLWSLAQLLAFISGRNLVVSVKPENQTNPR